MKEIKPLIGISVDDPAGIEPEVTAKTLAGEIEKAPTQEPQGGAA